ncbi:MAG: Gp49 family protein [Pseudomonadota bacterium]|nr:Gp49 family protein [Pseudomonadota bacterium]
MGGLEQTDAESAAVQKTPHRVSLESIKEKISGVEYLHPNALPTMTIAVVTMKNGYAIVGKSAPADPENFNPELGCKFAYEDAVRQIWPLEGYALRERLAD